MNKVTGAIDGQTRCKHYHSELDIIAIKFKCCDTYYGCYYCHEETVNHEAMVWPKLEWHTKAILCGSCHTELSINQYLNSSYVCPSCNSPFNPGCSNHNHLYFASASE
ncbi:hypothetical protein GC093_24500 [Paenibacillus sp. LMG 31456]|uniref:CHY-type domain-containing protein n=1 Tax=Paenibacillus foliorum TaxID=2654974 RepID=A0A972K235_9BACL|nr:hypothetical protein [Paenibacillus foliorum]